MPPEQQVHAFIDSIRRRNRREVWASVAVFAACAVVAAGAIPTLNPIGGMLGLAAAALIFGISQFVVEPQEPAAGWTPEHFANEVHKQGTWMLWAPLWYVAPIMMAMLAAIPAATSVLSLLIVGVCGFLAVYNFRLGQGLRHSAQAIRSER